MYITAAPGYPPKSSRLLISFPLAFDLEVHSHRYTMFCIRQEAPQSPDSMSARPLCLLISLSLLLHTAPQLPLALSFLRQAPALSFLHRAAVDAPVDAGAHLFV